MLDAVALELVTVGCAEDFVASNLRGDDLTDDITVGEAYNETVFGGVVLVLGLGYETLASIVICLSCTTALVLGLVATVLLSVKSSEPPENYEDNTHL